MAPAVSVVDGSHVAFHAPEIVSVLSRHDADSHVVAGAQQVLLAYCRAIDASRSTAVAPLLDDSNRTAVLVDALAGLERRLSDGLRAGVEVGLRAGIDGGGLREGLQSCVREGLLEGQRQMQQLAMSHAVTDARLDAVRESVGSVAVRVDQLLAAAAAAKGCSRTKGIEGEARLLELLSQRLPCCDGYDVRSVAGAAHNCDIAVRRVGYPDVRVECKAFTDKVPTRDVDKFVRDLTQLDQHGIMVSMSSGIVGRAKHLELQLLPSGKYAVFLSNNDYDVDIIHNVLFLLYRLDAATRDVAADCADSVRVSHDTLRAVQLHLQDFARKVAATKAHLKDAVGLLNDIAFSAVESLLLAGTPVGGGAHVAAGGGPSCGACGRSFASLRGLAAHRAACPRKNQNAALVTD
jgi:hypothetical protein